MKTFFDFYIFEDEAARYLPGVTGQRETIWLKVTVAEGDDTYKLVERVHQKLRADSPIAALVHGWDCFRKYSAAELEAAELFHMHVGRLGAVSMPSNQTVYNWSDVCRHCGAGRKQIKPLEINLKRLPRSRPIVCTIASEWLISEEFAELLQKEHFTGFTLKPVRNNEKAVSDQPDKAPLPSEFERYASGRELLQRARAAGLDLTQPDFLHWPYWWFDLEPNTELWRKCIEEHNDWLRDQESPAVPESIPRWYQLDITSKPILTCKPTKFGINPFDEDKKGQYRCPKGHVGGQAVLSEIYVPRSAYDGSDIVATKNLIGYRPRGGFLVPEPMILISPRFYRFLLKEKVKGLIFEVAHLVD